LTSGQFKNPNFTPFPFLKPFDPLNPSLAKKHCKKSIFTPLSASFSKKKKTCKNPLILVYPKFGAKAHSHKNTEKTVQSAKFPKVPLGANFEINIILFPPSVRIIRPP